MKTLEEIRTKLKDRRPGIVAQATGLHYNTVREIRDNPKTNPTWTTLKALAAYFDGEKNNG